MASHTNAQFVAPSQLRVGMFIHLDVGWMGHPFPLSSFKISSPSQIETIKGLGLKRVRYSPDRSEPTPEPVQVPPQGAAATGADAQAGEREAEQRARRELLAQQHASLRQCERQFAEAVRVYRQTTELCASRPQEASAPAQALVRGFIDRITGTGETCIRLLSEGAGDRASMHVLNVTVISLLLGRALGSSGDDLMDLGMGALLHDIGKVELPERVRNVDASFTSAQTRLYQEHVAHGVSLALRMGLSAGVLLAIGQHHEHGDGSGFPARLSLERLGAAGKIIALVNRYDNLCNPVSPLLAHTPHEALSVIFAQFKSRYDPTVLGAFIKMMGVYPPGSVVQLSDERYALVISVNAARPLRPRVLVHDAKVPRDEALMLDLEDVPELGIRRSLKPQQLPRVALDYLSPRQRFCYFFERAREVLPGEGQGA